MDAANQTSTHRKHYLPLESNPEVFTDLIYQLGATSLEFQDVFSLDPDLLALVPRPVLALVLVFPTSETHERYTAEEEAARPVYTGSGDSEEVIWFQQTIHNACGLYAILHAVSNGHARHFIKQNSALAKLLEVCIPLAPHDRALALEDSKDLKVAHAHAAKQGQSVLPSSAEDEVDFHYVAFVQSKQRRHLYEMDGDKKGPVDRGPLPEDEDLLGEKALNLVKEFIDRESGTNMNFSLMALVSRE